MLGIDLTKERLKNEADFCDCLMKFGNSNNAVNAILDTLYNDTYNGFVVDCGYNEAGDYCVELANVVNLSDRKIYKLDKNTINIEDVNIGSFLTFEWFDSEEPKIFQKHNQQYEQLQIANIGNLIDAYLAIADALDIDSSDAIDYSAKSLATDALNNLYYNLEFNSTEYNSLVQNSIEQMVRCQVLKDNQDLSVYGDVISSTLSCISYGVRIGYIENAFFKSRKLDADNFSDFSEYKKNSKSYLKSCIKRGVSDREKMQRFKNRLANIKNISEYSFLNSQFGEDNFMVLSRIKDQEESYVHILILDSFSRDFVLNVKSIEKGHLLKPGTIFRGMIFDDGEIVNVKPLSMNDEKTRLKNISKIKKLVDAQKKLTGLTQEDKEDLIEQNDYVLYSLKQYCVDIGRTNEFENKWQQMVYASKGKKQQLGDEIYNQIVGKMQEETVTEQSISIHNAR